MAGACEFWLLQGALSIRALQPGNDHERNALGERVDKIGQEAFSQLPPRVRTGPAQSRARTG